MKNMFRILAKGNPTQLEMSRNVLDLGTKITSYINDNFTASDFFTIGNARHEDVSKFLDFLKEAQDAMNSDDDILSLSLDKGQYRIFGTVFWYGRNFGDDIPELEALHDDICDIEIENQQQDK